MRLLGLPLDVAVPTPAQLTAAGSHLVSKARRQHLADLRPMPRRTVDVGRTRTVSEYAPLPGVAVGGRPVLLVPPLAAPALCFDLRRGCSLVEHLLGAGMHTFLVDYGPIAFADRDRGLEHWVDEVLPAAARAVERETGQAPLLVSWSLGGILSLLAVAADPEVPVAGVVAVGTPFDVSQVPLVAPLRPLVALTGGRLGTLAYRALGTAPAPLVQRAFRLTSLDKEIGKPLAMLLNLDDRDYLAQLEAVDRFMSNMLAYPGRTFGQLYHRVLRSNDIARGRIQLAGRTLDLADVRVPVMAVAGTGDGIAPVGAVHHVGRLLPHAAEVRLTTAPGGHLGVLTGRGARATTWVDVTRFLRDHGAGARPAADGSAEARRGLTRRGGASAATEGQVGEPVHQLVVDRPAGDQQPVEDHRRQQVAEQVEVGAVGELPASLGALEHGLERLLAVGDEAGAERRRQLRVVMHRAEHAEHLAQLAPVALGHHPGRQHPQVTADAAGVDLVGVLDGRAVQRRDHQVRLVRPPPVHRGLARPRPVGHRVDGQVVVADLGEQLQRRLEQRRLPGAVTGAPQRSGVGDVRGVAAHRTRLGAGDTDRNGSETLAGRNKRPYRRRCTRRARPVSLLARPGACPSGDPMTATTSAPVGAPAPAEHEPEHRLGLALAVICAAQLMVVLDATIVNIALPKIQVALGFSVANLAWVVTAYSLAFGGLLLLGGRAGDILGRRRVFITGIAVFTVASLLGGIAQTEGELLAARVLQGIGAAIASPTALALITSNFPEGKPRNSAFGIYAAMSGSGAAIGLLLGGVLTSYLDWRWVFFVNIPIGAVVLVLAPRVLRESTRSTGRFDVPGALLATGGLVSLVYGFTHAASTAWSDTTTLTTIAVGVVALLVFVAVEQRSAHALMPLRIFRNRNRVGALVIMGTVASAMFATFFFLSQYLQDVLGYSPVRAGIAFLPISVGIIVSAQVASRLIPRTGPLPLVVFGTSSAALALGLMTHFGTTTSYPQILVALMILSLGMGNTFVPLTLTAVSGVAREESGLASGLLNTFQQVGGALGLAVLATFSARALKDKVAELVPAGTVPVPGASLPRQILDQAAVAGYTRAFEIGSLMALGALLFALAMIRNPARGVVADSAEPVLVH